MGTPARVGLVFIQLVACPLCFAGLGSVSCEAVMAVYTITAVGSMKLNGDNDEKVKGAFFACTL